MCVCVCVCVCVCTYIERENLDVNLKPYTKSNSRQMTDLNSKHKTINLLFKKGEKSLISKSRQELTPNHHPQKRKISALSVIK
jgi:hypothetical protein